MKLAFIGCGNMGEAILDGILASNIMKKEDICVCVTERSLERIKKEKQVYTTIDVEEAFAFADAIILAIKPFKFEEVLSCMKGKVKDKLIISVAAGVTIEKMHQLFENDALAIVRTMPNTPACVKEAMTSLTFNAYINEQQKQFTREIFNSFGKTVEVEEDSIHHVIMMSGSSPAYVFMFMSAMIKNGIKHGLSEKQALEMCTQAVLGSAKMLMETKIDPEILKKNVCSPNGTTIEAVKSFEEDGLYEIVEKAMDACFYRSIELSKEN